MCQCVCGDEGYLAFILFILFILLLSYSSYLNRNEWTNVKGSHARMFTYELHNVKQHTQKKKNIYTKGSFKGKRQRKERKRVEI